MSEVTVTRPLTIPDGTRQRLRTFYGSPVLDWLDTVAATIDRTAYGWGVTIDGYHDRGWTSVIAHGFTNDNEPVIIKAVPDPARYHRELATLRHWDSAAAEVLASDDATRTFLLPMVGHSPGGATPPHDHELRTALRLPSLHRRPATRQRHVPDLQTLFNQRIQPQINASQQLKQCLGSNAVAAITRLGQLALDRDRTRTMLHGDLYFENVVFNTGGHPTFVDPRGITGPAAYDWAFWCVFYLDDGLERRLAMIDRLGLVDRAAVIPWIVVITADSLRHHLQAGDHPGAQHLQAILAMPAVREAIGG